VRAVLRLQVHLRVPGTVIFFVCVCVCVLSK
jgi:hypothetical protein